MAINSYSVALVGCGSVGSHLSMALAKCGVRKFLLMDDDDLEPENIPRHLCDLVDASQPIKKVEAVKHKLARRFPDIECVTVENDVLEFLRSGETKLNEYDVIIMAVGSFSVERRINYAVKKRILIPPIIYVWIEPYGVAGQILFINSRKGGCYLCCFDEKASFIYSVVNPEQIFSKREAGCQITYLPYAALEVEQFVLSSSEIIIKLLGNTNVESQLYTWFGDFRPFAKMGYEIKKIYLDEIPHTIKKSKINVSELCELCEKQK